MSLTSSRIPPPPPPPPPTIPNPVPPTQAAPAPVSGDPSDADIRFNMKDIAINSCIFYAGKVGTEPQVKKKRNERGYLSGYKILEEIWKEIEYPSITVAKMAGGKKASFQRFFSRASRVLAEDCSGTVYVFLPTGSGGDWSDAIFDKSIWKNDEWPALVANGRVSKVICLDWTNADHQETIKDSLPKRSVTAIEARDSNDKCTLYPGYRVFGHPNARLPGVLRCR
jgi:hypothetical protein